MNEIECPSCNSTDLEPIDQDKSLRSFIMTFSHGRETRKCCQCRDCGNRFQVIDV